jgi:hypothetical protein
MCRARIAGLLLIALGLAVPVGVSSRAASAAPPCWERVIADWSDNGRVDRTYPLSCYREAVKHMPEDLRAYSTAPAAIDRALTERRADRPVSVRSAAPPLASASLASAPATSGVAVLVPLAGVLVAAGVAWWLLRARNRPDRAD